MLIPFGDVNNRKIIEIYINIPMYDILQLLVKPHVNSGLGVYTVSAEIKE